MQFEYDPWKSFATWVERGIWFDEAKYFWEDPGNVIVPARRVDNEERRAIYATYKGKIWCAVFTERDEKIRIISVRRADAKGIRSYRGT